MSLDYILLGMLERPAAGYDLGREFEASARMFWAAELSQIYPTLKRLEARGYLTSREVPSDRGPNRKVYDRTPAGTAALEEWLRQTPELGSARLPHVAQFYFLGRLGDPSQSIEFVEALRDELKTRIAVYEEIERCMGAERGDPATGSDDLFHKHATLRAGMLVARARLAWCNETLAGLEARLPRTEARVETGVS